MEISRIRNFCIIAHIDHGKSTLADRILEITGAMSKRQMTEQVLDKMELERERGITIKLKPVRIECSIFEDKGSYEMNLIDTPGHVDFNYEVSRSLAACEGALLVVDATQGIEAQTLANLYLALDHDLEIVPVVNKIDLPNADPDKVAKEICELIGMDDSEIIRISAKTGKNVEAVLKAIIDKVPAPSGDSSAPLKALIFDSHFDPYKGVMIYIRVMEGSFSTGDRIRIMSNGMEFDIIETGVFTPEMKPTGSLSAGEVGYIAAQIKNMSDARVGDTVTLAKDPASEPLPGYRQVHPMVYTGLYPVENNDYPLLREALEKLKLNDSALVFEPESSAALGFGFRCGFLGLLHMEIVQARLEREYGMEIITTAPSVIYNVKKTDGTVQEVDNPAELPDVSEIEEIEEPIVRLSVLTPSEYIGAVMTLAIDRRGTYKDMNFLSPQRVSMQFEIPLAEILYDFFDKLKSKTRGYASMDYELKEYRPARLVKLDVLVNDRPLDALSSIVHSESAQFRGRLLVQKLRKIIPRQMFDVPIQAAVGAKIIARETVKAMRKDVLAKCYGGDISRKRKLLEKQKEGKKRLKQVGSVEIPQEAFMAVLSTEEEEE
ncbi:MAG TPA: translation elongation factor 4 [Bacillota bacterium]|nr:translation elongation factor 4 [Bacillota bacterium]HOH10656.1 translation elongation factor 4 [Bacillota bacterium]